MKVFLNILLIICLYGCSSSTSNFELCGGKLYPYYHPQLNYEGNFYAIKNAFYSNYSVIDSPNNTGIVKIRFHVNCNGNTGNFKVETYSLDFTKATLDSRISNQLLLVTQELEGWIPAINEDGEKVNSHKFFSFRIMKGKLVDILPK